MEQEICFKFLILCMCLSQGLAADSLDHLVRQKRVIDLTANANTRVRRLQDVNYIVQVQKNLKYTCAGSILSANVILTLASCVQVRARYSIKSGTISSRSGGLNHLVNGILLHPQFVRNNYANDLALLSIENPIALGPNRHEAATIYNLNDGILPPNSMVTVSGWGLAVQQRSSGIACLMNRGRGRVNYDLMPSTLQSITLNTISINVCRARHPNDPRITNEVICTFHEQKFCGPKDNGDPLVFEGRLAGIMVKDGFLSGPDIYVNVGLPVHRNWIIGHMDRIPRYDPPPYRSPSPSPPNSPRRHNHRNPQHCSQVHPCDSD